MSFFKTLEKAAKHGKGLTVAAPIAGAVLGGPAGAAAGRAVGNVFSKNKPPFTPSSASNIGAARSADKAVMGAKYPGLGTMKSGASDVIEF